MKHVYLDYFKSKEELRRHLLKDQDNLCYLCNKPFTKNNKPTIDHIVPLAKGGGWNLENLALAHRSCNVDKGDRMLLEDGTLEPRRKNRRKVKNKRIYKRLRNSICQYCLNGRLLDRTQTCQYCSSSAGPPQNPWYLKSAPKNCDHSLWWCCVCASGMV